MPKWIYLSPPDVGPAEEAMVVDAVRSGWVAPMGPHIDAFEQEMCARIGTSHAVALSSGTAALHLALLEMGARPGTVVVVPTLTFVATANAVAYTGARPVFVDCLLDSGNIDAELLDDCLHQLTSEGEQVVAVISVDLFGKAAEYDSLLKVCKAHCVELLEDAAESLGASYRGRPAGSFGRAGVLSFNGNKILTTSGGGMLLTDDAGLAARARHLSTQARQPVVEYEHLEVGYNYRLSNVLAALGRAQLSRLDEMLVRRREIRDGYRSIFAAVPGVELLGGADDAEDNCWLSVIVVDEAVTGWSSESLAKELTAGDVETRPVWKPMHRQPLFADARSFVTGAADRLFEQGLTLPSGSKLNAADEQRVQSILGNFLTRCP
jgi:dTDP-4-amino-4,6-dideoxygalactose transaminase